MSFLKDHSCKILLSFCSAVLSLTSSLPQESITSALHFLSSTFPQQYISSAVHFLSSTFPQQYISSAVHFLSSTFPQQYISSAVLYLSSTLSQRYIPQQFITSATHYTAKTKCRKFETNIPRKEISGPQSQFPHSCVCERIIYSRDGSAFSAGGNMWTDPGNIYISLTDT